MGTYEKKARTILPNGLTLLQTNPDCAVDLISGSRYYGWLYVRGPEENQWVTQRKLTSAELDEAYDQAADFVILNAEDQP